MARPFETRAFALERGVFDAETGEFWATVATNGEAGDNHILDIASVRVADQVPMFANHVVDATRQLGSWTQPRKVGKVTRLGEGKLKMLGRLPQDGDGAMADVRRDVGKLIASGDIKTMSTHWDPRFESVPRRSLKKNHFAYSEMESTWEEPLFIKNWSLLENSVVGLPSDQAALVGRMRNMDLEPHVRKFYDVLVNGDPLSRERLLEEFYEAGVKIEGMEEIESTTHGLVFVPREMAGVWGQSIEEDEPQKTLPKEVLRSLVQEWLVADRSPEDLAEIEREQASLTDEEGYRDKILRLLGEREPTSLNREMIDFGIELERHRVEQGWPIRSGDATEEPEPEETQESTEPEPIDQPDSETTERAEPSDEPALSTTASAAVALLDLPELPIRADVIQEGIAQKLKEWKATELGYVE